MQVSLMHNALLVLTFLAQVGRERAPKAQRPLKVVTLIDRSRSLPPEFSTDLLLRSAGSPLIPDPGWKEELIEEAFQSAQNAQFPAPRGGSRANDARFGGSALGSWVRLDRFTLQVRAAELMLTFRPTRARELFENIRLPQFASVPCTSLVTERTGGYYELIPRIFTSGFTAEQRKKETDLRMVEQAIRGMHADVQIEPIAAMIERFQVPQTTVQDWLNAFASTLPFVQGSDRTFTVNVWIGLTGLLRFSQKAGLERAPLLAATRSYIVSRLHAPQCEDMADKTGLTPWIESLNGVLTSAIAQGYGDLRPLEEEDLKRGPNAGTFTDPQWWQSPQSKAILDALRWLNHGNRDLPDSQRFWTTAERNTQEWNDRYLDLRKLLADWKPAANETAEDLYHMKAVTYDRLARLVPPGSRQRNAIQELLAFLDQSYSQIANHAEWFSHVQPVIDGKENLLVMEEAVNSKNPVISLYATLQTMSAGR